jgi:hypothetical protein
MKSRRLKWAENIARMGLERNAHKNPEGKRPIGRHK